MRLIKTLKKMKRWLLHAPDIHVVHVLATGKGIISRALFQNGTSQTVIPPVSYVVGNFGVILWMKS